MSDGYRPIRRRAITVASDEREFIRSHRGVRAGRGCYVPTEAALGPWSPEALHGAAVAALLAGVFESEGEVVVRVFVELLGPVPRDPLRIDLGRAVADAVCNDRAQSSTQETGRSRQPRRPGFVAPTLFFLSKLPRIQLIFDPAQMPDLGPAQPTRGPYCRMAQFRQPCDGISPGTQLWTRVAQVVAPARDADRGGEMISGTQRAVAAADYASGGTSERLAFDHWSYMNADLTVGLSRPVRGEWIGLSCEGIVQPTGTGLSIGAIHDSVVGSVNRPNPSSSRPDLRRVSHRIQPASSCSRLRWPSDLGRPDPAGDADRTPPTGFADPSPDCRRKSCR